ncbi:hypothetical protein AAFC00_002840 [Neodothiora populina]|uniref:Transcription initiation factor TFIID subunit 1 histone acetyltransferase domain-containing protein n=1 Tax=Neodothiora populina TaxID=2781224 RepID=A0ABR3P8E3_9PEZI
MPHAVEQDELDYQQNDDLGDDLFNQILNAPPESQSFTLDLDRDLDIGEKADDAQDFEDIGDDDLAEDEDELADAPAARNGQEAINGGQENAPQNPDGEEGFDDDMDFTFGDDLFGDDDQADQNAHSTDLANNANNNNNLDSDAAADAALFAQETEALAPSSPPTVTGGLALPSKRVALPGSRPLLPGQQLNGLASSLDTPLEDDLAQETQTYADEEEEDDEEDDQVLEQRRLFEQMAIEREQRLRGGDGDERLPAAEADLETFYNIWPTYDPEERPRFVELFPQRRGHYPWKTPIKPPKAVQPTKVNLELLPDQEKSFRLPGTATTNNTWSEPHGTIYIQKAQKEGEESEDGIDIDEVDENEVIGGATWQDLTLVCIDWDLPSVSSSPAHTTQFDSGIDMSGDVDDMDGPPQKKRKVAHGTFDLKEAVAFSQTLPSLDDPERAAAKIAKKVQLDMNDPGLLIDENVPITQPRKVRRLVGDMGREAKSAAARDMTRRYNISNDEEYEQLKANHQHKVRSTLGSMAVEHSVPATKLQFPFYRVSLEEKQKRSFHRPTFTTERHDRTWNFHKVKRVKRKELKGKETSVVFAKAEDLSMADNSSVLLLEYSEEQPIMLSNFGMGNRLINYYRRKDANDTSRPKEELGETQVLLPQDRSPFANFGQVDPGEMVPTIHNGLYRAPIFKHEPRNTDFLVISNTSSGTGRQWFLRNIENIHAVGQQFPSVEVPGEHSRKVTDAAKKRLQNISYRIHKKYTEHRGPPLTNEVVKAHLPGSDIAQNRGKMRDFMAYDKNNGLWHLKPGHQMPDLDHANYKITPEEICVLDSMQVGVQHLKDLGLRRDDEEDNDDNAQDDDHIELLLAPWNTTKNFLHACQGKAMLQLHGEGDPTARGEGFSFIKTSMKGGFRALGESVAERLDAKKIKENGGHSYNVAKQQKAYDESIRRIWKAQHESLASTMEHSDVEEDIDDEPESSHHRTGETPRSSFGTPAFSRRDDETMSQFSKFSATQNNNLVMYIERTVIDKITGMKTTETERVTNPRVIAAYKKRKDKERIERLELDAYKIKPTGDRAYDLLQLKNAQDELDRLKRNMDRRKARERAKAKPGTGAGSPPTAAGSPAPDGEEAGDGAAGAPTGKKGRAKKNAEGTARKCANCGQIGHIRTNKKLCPMLNGTMKQEDATATGFGGPAGGAGAPQNGEGGSGTGGFGGMSLPLAL